MLPKIRRGRACKAPDPAAHAGNGGNDRTDHEGNVRPRRIGDALARQGGVRRGRESYPHFGQTASRSPISALHFGQFAIGRTP